MIVSKFFVDLYVLNIFIKLLFLSGLLFGQALFNGKWYKVGTNWLVYINIYETSEGQFLERYMKVSDNQNLLSTKEIIQPWIGDSYTQTEYSGNIYNAKLKQIDDKSILYGGEIYRQYELPRDFLKGN